MKILFFLVLCAMCGAEEQHVKAINSFAFKVYSILAKKSSNVFFSPASLSTALASTSLAAKGETLKQLVTKMSWGTQDTTKIHTDMQNYLQTLRSTKNDETKVRFANRLYADNSIKPSNDFNEKMKTYYGVDLGRLNFAGKPSPSRKELNIWVKNETASKIKNFIPYGYLTSETKLIVANTIHFNGPWLKGFKGKLTFLDGKFKLGNSKSLEKIPLMRLEDNFKYGDCKKLKADVLEMFYEGKKFSMIVFLPKGRLPLKETEKRLNSNTYKSCLSSMRERKIQIFLPRFKFREDIQLKNILVEMGITNLFESTADLSGLTVQNNIKVDEIFHRAFISVGEKGGNTNGKTEKGDNAGEKTKIFRADHPFIFFIKENTHGSILLMGRVMEPKQDLDSLKKKDRKSDN